MLYSTAYPAAEMRVPVGMSPFNTAIRERPCPNPDKARQIVPFSASIGGTSHVPPTFPRCEDKENLVSVQWRAQEARSLVESGLERVSARSMEESTQFPPSKSARSAARTSVVLGGKPVGVQ